MCGKAAVAAGVRAGDIIRSVTAICGGKGGGKPDSAMGGGADTLKLDDARYRGRFRRRKAELNFSKAAALRRLFAHYESEHYNERLPFLQDHRRGDPVREGV